jgi:hypothetical protein
MVSSRYSEIMTACISIEFQRFKGNGFRRAHGGIMFLRNPCTLFVALSPYEEKPCILRGKIARSSRQVGKMPSFPVVEFVVHGVTTVLYSVTRISETSM